MFHIEDAVYWLWMWRQVVHLHQFVTSVDLTADSWALTTSLNTLVTRLNLAWSAWNWCHWFVIPTPCWSWTPIEETVAIMAELVKVGKVSYLWLHEGFRETLRRTYKHHPIASVKMEYCLLIFGHCIMNFRSNQWAWCHRRCKVSHSTA